MRIRSIHDDVVFKIYDKGVISDDLLGICPIKVSALSLNAEREEQQDWFSVFLNNQRVGLLSLGSKFEIPPGEKRCL